VGSKRLFGNYFSLSSVSFPEES